MGVTATQRLRPSTTFASGSDVAVAIQAVEGEADFRTLRELFVEYEADLPPHLRHGAVPELAELLDTYVKKSRAFLAFTEKSSIGCVAVREFDPSTALLLRLYVTPEHRGRGAARSLVIAAIEFAREGAYRRIVLDTNKEALEPAFRLYRTLGFIECEPFTAVTYASPTFMELKLSRRSDLNR
jgi:GNAT superfamily N-acetyltransferase